MCVVLPKLIYGIQHVFNISMLIFVTFSTEVIIIFFFYIYLNNYTIIK